MAVSGGPDSMAMLYLFAELRKSLGLYLETVHLNHHIREEEADLDAQFVEHHCSLLNVSFKLFHFRIPDFAKKNKISIETAGHRIRHHLFGRYAAAKKFDYSAFAHTANDQAETVFMNLMRGAGLKGLSGIPFKRGSIIRPLLSFYRKEIMKYLNETELPYRIDSSNFDSKYQRNLIRSELFPLLEEKMNRRFQANLVRTALIFQDEEKWFEELISPHFIKRFHYLGYGVYELEIKSGEFAPLLERRMLRKFILAAEKNLEGVGLEHIEKMREILDKKTGKQFLFSRIVIEKTNKGVALSRTFKKIAVSTPVSIPGEVFVKNLRFIFKTELIPIPNSGFVRKNFLDFERLLPPFYLRFRQEGDWFHQPGTPGRKKLQDYFVDQKIPRALRDRIPLFTANNSIVWIGGFAVSEKALINQQTKKLVRISLSHA